MILTYKTSETPHTLSLSTQRQARNTYFQSIAYVWISGKYIKNVDIPVLIYSRSRGNKMISLLIFHGTGNK